MNKLEREKQILYINTHVGNLERWHCWTYLQGSNGDANREQTYGDGGGGRNGWEWHGNICATICKLESQWEFAVWLRELKLGLCDNLEEWDGMRGGKEVQEGGDICKPMADSCWCMAETIKSNYPLIKNEIKLCLKKKKTAIEYIPLTDCWIYSKLHCINPWENKKSQETTS